MQVPKITSKWRRKSIFFLVFLLVFPLSACAARTEKSGLQIVASTPIVADMVEQVAGKEAEVVSLIPRGADPHSYEPSLAALRNIAWADIAFTNGLLLESAALQKTLKANLPAQAEIVELAAHAPEHGGYHIRLVEDFSLSTLWLGFRSEGIAENMEIRATDLTGPGTLAAFTTATFGTAHPWIVSGDGFDDADKVALPPDAHTHMSWAMSAPGVYDLHLSARPTASADSAAEGEGKLADSAAEEEGSAADSPGKEMAAVLRFVVGENPQGQGRTVLDSGHADITVTPHGIKILADKDGEKQEYSPEEVLIAVPHSTLAKVPVEKSWRFLGKPEADTWILAQAVLGEHVHGEIDPHLWQDAVNGLAYIDVITDELSSIAPEKAEIFQKNAARYREKLQDTDNWMRSVIGSIPLAQRKLVTTHDAFGYLAKGYGLEVSGVVAPNPAIEPSSQQLATLARTLQDLHVRAVFVEPTTRRHKQDLLNLAAAQNIEVCNIYADTLTPEVPNYLALLKYNGKALKNCLDPGSLPAWEPEDVRRVALKANAGK